MGSSTCIRSPERLDDTLCETISGTYRPVALGSGHRFAQDRSTRSPTSNGNVNLIWPHLWQCLVGSVFELGGQDDKDALDAWLQWAQRSRIPEFVEVGRQIRRHRQSIDASLEHGFSNGPVESTNIEIRLLTRMAFGFKSPDALISLALLALGGNQPNLPRTAT